MSGPGVPPNFNTVNMKYGNSPEPAVDVQLEKALAFLATQYGLDIHQCEAVRAVLASDLPRAQWHIQQAVGGKQ